MKQTLLSASPQPYHACPRRTSPPIATRIHPSIPAIEAHRPLSNTTGGTKSLHRGSFAKIIRRTSALLTNSNSATPSSIDRTDFVSKK